MKFSLLLAEVKVFTRAISALGKLGDEIYFECGPHEFSLRCVNSSRSAFAVIHFSECFFENASKLADAVVRFKLNAKTCCKVFRQTVAWDKALQRCKMRLETGHNRLIVQFFQRHGIVKTYDLPIIECESLEAVYSISNTTCQIVMSSKVASEIMQNFRPSQTEVTMDLQEDFAAVITHIPVASTEFEAYRLGEECDLTFCQKDFRAALMFGNSMNALFVINCSRPGKPLVLTFTDEKHYKAHFVLATLPLPYFPTRIPLNSINALSQSRSRSNVDVSVASPFDDTHQEIANPPLNTTLMTASTQVLHSSNHETSTAQLTASTPLAVHCQNETEPPIKKARSVLFSYLGGGNADDSFFLNPPPAQEPESLCEDSLEDDSAGDRGDGSSDAATCGRLTTRRADVRVAATAGWRSADGLCAPPPGHSSPTLLVADSDEET
ncbi:Cell cycle checkpoint control protein RAD9A [Echinococcus granulosus]|nr:Cell cycle checkpoint control protein RAD9A [Echinococcus granulosus]